MIPPTVVRTLDSEGFLHFRLGAAEKVGEVQEDLDSPIIESLAAHRSITDNVMVNQGIYEEIILSSTSYSLSGSKESAALKFLQAFFSRYNSVPKEFLSELQQAAIWAEKLENIDPTSQEKAKAQFEGLVREIRDYLQNMPQNGGCILPGGTHIIIRVVKNLDSTYSMLPFSRSADVQHSSSVNLGGREKICNFRLDKLTLQDLDEDFIKNLLSLSQNGKQSIHKANALFANFKPKVALNSNSRFHISKSSVCRYQNISDLLQEGYARKPSLRQKSRQKLELQIKVFCEYFEYTKASLNTNSLAYKYLEAGLKVISRNILWNQSRNYLNQVEASYISASLIQIQESLNQIKLKQTTPKLLDSIAPSSLTLNIKPVTLREPTVPIVSSEALDQPKRHKQSLTSPYILVDKKYDKPSVVHSPLTVSNCQAQLDGLLNTMKRKDLIPLQREQQAVEFCLSLPLDPKSANDIWKSLTQEQRIQVSHALAEISSTLLSLINLNVSNCPNRILAMAKLAIICEHLARLNGSVTNIENLMFCPELLFLLVDLMRGSAGYSGGLSQHRILIGHSGYPVYTLLEESALQQCKSYYEALLDLSPTYREYVKDLKNENERAHNRHNDFDGGVVGWTMFDNGKKYERHDCELDLTKKQYKDNVQCQDLLKAINNIRLEVKSNKTPPLTWVQRYARSGVSCPNPLFLAGTFSRWGKTIKNPLLLAVFYACHPEKGILDSFSVETNTFTQEAIMDDPWLAVERAYKNWQLDLSSDHPLKKKTYQQIAYTAKPELLQDFSEKDLKELLIALEPSSGFWNMLGLIKKNPVLLKNTDFQSIVERMLLQPESLKKAMQVDPKLPQFLSEFFEEHIKQFERIQEYALALFMMHLYHALRTKMPADALPAAGVDFKVTLNRWYQEALQPKSAWRPYLYNIISEMLSQMAARKQLGHHELKELAILYGIWENTPAFVLADPIDTDNVRKLYYEWLPQIEHMLKEDAGQKLRRHIIEAIAKGRELEFINQEEGWQGSFPLFNNTEWQYNFTSGNFTNLSSKSTLCALPPAILNDTLFQEAFPVFSEAWLTCSTYSAAGKTYYQCQDSQGIQNLIEKSADGIAIYKSHPKHLDVWLQYLPVERKSLDNLGRLGAHNRLYVSLQQNQVIFFNQHGQPEFSSDLSHGISSSSTEVIINALYNMNPQRAQHEGLQAVVFDPQKHTSLKFLLNIAASSEILLWTKYGQLQKIEFYALELAFEIVNEQLVCQSAPFKGSILDLQESLLGLPAGLTLLSADANKQTAQLLLPYFSGEYVIQKPEVRAGITKKADKAATFLWNAGKSYLGYTTPAVESASTSLWNAGLSSLGYKVYPQESASQYEVVWKSEASPSKGYWCFSIHMPDLKLTSMDSAQGFKAYFDLFKYSIRASQANVSPAILAAKECLRNIREIPKVKLLDKDIESFADEITGMVAGRSKISSKPHLESVSLALQALLLLRDFSTPHLQNKIGHYISKLVPLYYKHGRQMHLRVRLDEKQELSCLLLMKTHDFGWFKQHAALLKSTKNSLSLSPDLHTHRNRANRAPLPPLAIESWNHQKYFKPVGSIELARYQEPEDTAEDFISLYEAARNPHSTEFQAVHKVIKKLAAHTDEKEDLQDEIRRITGGKVKKSGNSTNISRKENYAETILLYRYLEAVYHYQASQESKNLPKLEKYDEAAIEAFCKQLTAWVDNNLRLSKQISVTSKEIPDDKEDFFEELSRHVALPLEMLTLETGLEQRLSLASSTVKQAPSVCLQKGDCLIEGNKLVQDYFKPVVQKYSFEQLGLSQLEQVAEPAVKKVAEGLQKEIDALQNTQATKYKFKDLRAITQLKTALENSKSALQLYFHKLKADIEKQLALSQQKGRAHDYLRQWAGYDTQIRWDELYVAFLQGSFESMTSRFPDNTDISKLRLQLMDYFKKDVNIKSIDHILSQLAEFEQDPSLIQSSNSAHKIFELLSRERCYDVAHYSELLAMESLLGFRIREDQLCMVIDFIQKPHSIRQAATGAGKTNVILPLVGLMKANGTNLVSLKFLDPLFNESCERLQKLLGASFGKKIFPLLFSGSTPLTCDRVVNGKNQKQSIFKYFYEEAIKVIVNKGCLVTNKRSQPLLKAKMIEIYERLSQLDAKDRPLLDLEHLKYLGKLLGLFKDREEALYDEFDKFLSAREELHLRIGQGKPLPAFVSEAVLNVYDYLIHNSDLNLKDNTQAELSPSKQREIIMQTIDLLDNEWEHKKGIAVKDYFTKTLQGTLSEDEESDFLKLVESKLDPKDRDILCLQRDLLTEFLPSTLFKSADQRYIRSKLDEKSVIPCDYADVPKEGSEFEDIRVKLCYLIQYYYQKGPSFAFFNQWVNGLKSQAIESLMAGEEAHITKTAAEKVFKDYFPAASLEGINKEVIQSLYKQVKKSPQLIRKFLKVLAQEQKLPGKKISLNPHNQVSIAKASAGTSATKGCLAGLHRGFNVDAQSSHSNAMMLHRMLQRINTEEPFLTFSQKSPKGIISELVAKDKQLKVVIDGAGALRGMPFEKPAKQLLEGQPGLKAVGYFDHKGKLQCLGDAAEIEQKGLVYSNSQARGADAAIHVHHKAVLLVNGRSSQEELSQNEGRLRKEDQKLRIAVPEGASIKNISDLINAALATEAQANSLDLLLSRQQEMQDLVHDQMCLHLAQMAAQAKFSEGFKAYKTYAPHAVLVSEFAEDWETPGSYYRLHKHIRRTKDTVAVLKALQQKYVVIAKSCQLDSSQQALEQLDMEKYRSQLPREISGDMRANQEVQIETETQTEVQTEIETAVEIDVDTDKPTPAFYLPWNWINDYGSYAWNSLQQAYDPNLRYSANFLPLSRNANAPSAHQRRAHDLRQNRLQHVEMSYFSTAMDIKDVSQTIFRLLSNQKADLQGLYDTRLNRYIAIIDEPAIKALEAETAEKAPSSQYLSKYFYQQGKKNLYIAQLKFEDGQYKGYTPGEWKALGAWIKQQPNPAALEDYFVQEVLKYRPLDRERYAFSPLRDLFQQQRVNQ